MRKTVRKKETKSLGRRQESSEQCPWSKGPHSSVYVHHIDRGGVGTLDHVYRYKYTGIHIYICNGMALQGGIDLPRSLYTPDTSTPGLQGLVKLDPTRKNDDLDGREGKGEWGGKSRVERARTRAERDERFGWRWSRHSRVPPLPWILTTLAVNKPSTSYWHSIFPTP